MADRFELVSPFHPTGDQPEAIDELVRDYMNAAPPIPHAPMPGNIEDPRIAVPVAKPVQPIKRRD